MIAFVWLIFEVVVKSTNTAKFIVLKKFPLYDNLLTVLLKYVNLLILNDLLKNLAFPDYYSFTHNVGITIHYAKNYSSIITSQGRCKI